MSNPTTENKDTIVSRSLSVADAQHEVRSVFMGGSVGQAVSGTLWIVSAAAASWGSVRAGILLLVLGGIFIFPLTQGVLRVLGRPASLNPENPLNGLAMQVAFIVPLLLPLAGAATLANINWFYPAMMSIVGAHYLPFVFLYGMRSFGLLAALLLGGGVALGLRTPEAFSVGAWFTGLALIVFAGWAMLAWRRESSRSLAPTS